MEFVSTVPPYHLAALLNGHTDDVRGLAASPSSQLFSVSRDSTARTWVRDDVGAGWQTAGIRGDHDGFINSVAWIPGGQDGQGYVATGGQDTVIQVYRYPSADSAPVSTLLGHRHNVCALHASLDGTRLVSGSWDGTARVWDTTSWECLYVLEHEGGPAVWDVLWVDKESKDSVVITATADNLIRLFRRGKQALVFKGHTGVVRALAKIRIEDIDGSLFASASNDGSVRIWSLKGDAVTVLGGHDSFIYALVSLPDAVGGGLASSGEDGIVKIWNDEEGDEEQAIQLPALSIWSLAALPNGDLAIGCSDHLIWVFTRDESRRADAATLLDFETRLAARTTKPRPLTLDKLPPIGSEGDVKLVDVDGVKMAYQWTDSSWVELGEVVDGDSTPVEAPRTMYEGVEYTHVFDVDIKEGAPPLKLPYNLGDDVSEVASAFVALHSLPLVYLSQIEDFISASTQ